jgi:hypothetical protein
MADICSFWWLAVTLMLCVGGRAQGQADTTRPRPPIRGVSSGVAAGAQVSDSIRPGDIDAVEVIKGPGSGMFFDRIGPARRRGMLDTLESQHRFWSEHRPRAYLVRLVVINDCIALRLGPRIAGELLRDRLVVRDTTVVGREPAPLPARYEQYCPRAWRVDDIFADVAHALADTSAYIMRIQYDAAYGFPRSYFVQRGRGRGDQVMIESFAPAP